MNLMHQLLSNKITRVYMYMCKKCGAARFSMMDLSVLSVVCSACDKETQHVQVHTEKMGVEYDANEDYP